MQDTRSARSHGNLPKLDPGSNKIFSVRDPRSPGSHGYIAVTGSDPGRKGKYNIQDPPRYRILDPGDPGSRILEDLGTCLSGMSACARVLSIPETTFSELRGIWYVVRNPLAIRFPRSIPETTFSELRGIWYVVRNPLAIRFPRDICERICTCACVHLPFPHLGDGWVHCAKRSVVWLGTH